MSWYIGVDPSSVRVGLAAIHENGELRHQVLHATGDVADRFVWLRSEIRRWLTPYADMGVMCVVIEDPDMHLAGSVVRASLGVVLEATRSMLPDTVVHVLKSTEVKRHALGNGAGKKADLMAGARLLGYAGSSQDAADAVCCADAARVLTAKNARKAAA